MRKKREYELILPKIVQNDLDGLNPKVDRRINKALDRIKEHPELAKRLVGKFGKIYSYRFGTPEGEYRIAFLLQNRKIIILAIKPRKEVYKILKRRV